jgi:hypothetical protein
MPLIIDTKQKDKLELTAKEITQVANDAYDRGGADVLKLLLDSLDSIQSTRPELELHCTFTRTLVEVTRQTLNEIVKEASKPETLIH